MARQTIPEGFYTYVLAYPDGTPFYVGKGHGKRYQLGGNEHARRVAAKIRRGGGRHRTEIIRARSEEGAFELEIELIKKYGRRDLGTGILCNFTDGGEGSAGVVVSEERRAAISAALIGNQHLLGHRHSDATRKRMSESSLGNKANLGNRASAETRERMIRSQKLRRADPAMQEKMHSALIRAWSNPEYRAKQVAAKKRHWAEPEYRSKMEAVLSDPKQRRKQSDDGKRRWADPEYRARMCQAMRGRKWTVAQHEARRRYLERKKNGTADSS